MDTLPKISDQTIKAGPPLINIHGPSPTFELHTLSIEWYESTRSLIRRKTDKELTVQVEKSSKDAYDDGDVIYDRNNVRITVLIKPCETIVLYPRNIQETGKICFEIGNQHVPIFLNKNGEIMAAYDANLFNLLQTGGFEMVIENRVLSPKQMVKAYGNFF